MNTGRAVSTQREQGMGVRSFGDEFKVYSTQFALDVFSGKNEAGTAYVVNMVIARKLVGSNEYDWKGDTIRMQISKDEIAPMLSVLLGYRPTVTIVHIPGRVRKQLMLHVNNASSDIAEQISSSYAIKMRTGDMGSARAVEIQDADRMKMAVFFFRVFMKNNGGIAQETLYSMLKDVYGRNNQ